MVAFFSFQTRTITICAVVTANPSAMCIIFFIPVGDNVLGLPDAAAKLLQPFPADQMHIAMEGGKSDDMGQVVAN